MQAARSLRSARGGDGGEAGSGDSSASTLSRGVQVGGEANEAPALPLDGEANVDAERNEPSVTIAFTRGGNPAVPHSTIAARRAVWNSHPAVQRSEWEIPASPLDLVAQLRGDYEQYQQQIADMASEPAATSIEDFRAHRRRERLQLDSLHARLHGLRLILAMARTRSPDAPPSSNPDPRPRPLCFARAPCARDWPSCCTP